MKTIVIDSIFPKAIILGLILGLFSVFIIEQFGEFEMYVDTSATDGFYGDENPLNNLAYVSPFGTRVDNYDTKMLVKDLSYVGSDSNFKYSEKLPYYFQAIQMEKRYVLLVSLLFTLTILFFKKFKVKFKSTK